MMHCAADPHLAERIRQAASPQTDGRQLAELILSEEQDIRLAVALNPTASVALLSHLKLSEPEQLAVALHPAADGALLQSLMENTLLPNVRRAIRHHPNYKQELSHSDVERFVQTILNQNSYLREQKNESVIYFSTLLSPHTSLTHLRTFVRQGTWEGRLAAALRLPVTEHQRLFRNTLSRDANRLVRAAARARLADPLRAMEW
jgi:hypothetical protein